MCRPLLQRCWHSRAGLQRAQTDPALGVLWYGTLAQVQGTEKEVPIETKGGALFVIEGAISAKIACINGVLQACIGAGSQSPAPCKT